jgi:glycerol kinase
MAYQIADVAEDMQKTGIKMSELRVDGGATKNAFMIQFQADLLGVPVVRSSQVESTAWGVAALAGLKAGLFKSEEDIEALWQRDITVQPKVKRDIEYGGWQKALKGAFACAGVEHGD